MPRGTLSNYCERCGQRIDVHGARPGKVDLGLDRVGSVFRYCSTCQLFVGRACCWTPDVLACTHGGPPGSETSVISASAVLARKEMALRGLADLRKSVDDLQQIAMVLDTHTGGGIALPSRQWDDAWEAAGWLITRADTTHAPWPGPSWRHRRDRHVPGSSNSTPSSETRGKRIWPRAHRLSIG